jgi:hypothetical protein
MHAGHDVPEIVLARIRSAGGPYRVDDAIAIAYCAPNVGRLLALDAAVRVRCAQYERTSIPEIVSAVVEQTDETLTLYFVDPAIARIRREAPPLSDGERVSYLSQDLRESEPQTQAGEPMTLSADDRMTDVRTANERGVDERTADPVLVTDRGSSADGAGAHRPLPSPTPAREAGIVVRLEWSAARVRRFMQVVDRLFTIDRLGWYRHTLAMRLLIPDEIHSGDELADVEAMRHLHALRDAAVSALGKPLLAACMPGFAVTSDWLETLESSREARAIAGLRDALLTSATDRAEAKNGPLRSEDAAFTVGTVSKRALLAEGATSVESFLPILIATQAHDAALCSRLTDYRNLLVELFAQTARATDPVRLGALTQPNHSLDDRLWQLVGAVGEAFGGFVHT